MVEKHKLMPDLTKIKYFSSAQQSNSNLQMQPQLKSSLSEYECYVLYSKIVEYFTLLWGEKSKMDLQISHWALVLFTDQ